MQPTNGRLVEISVQFFTAFVNAFLVLGFYAAQDMFGRSGMVKNQFTHVSEFAFAVGMIAALAVLLLPRKISFQTRWMFLVIATMLNQAALIAFVISTRPFRLG